MFSGINLLLSASKYLGDGSPLKDSPSKNNLRKKKSNNLGLRSAKERRSVTSKVTVEKYAIATSDELKRRYSYKCKKCGTIFESYGNEKKAKSQMMMHLHSHNLESPQKPVKNIRGKKTSSAVGVKKLLKAEHPSGVKIPVVKQKRTGNRRASTPKRKVTNDYQSVQKTTKSSNKVSSYTPGYENDRAEDMIVEEVVRDVTVEICGPLCSHRNCILSQPSTSKGNQPTVVYEGDTDSDEGEYTTQDNIPEEDPDLIFYQAVLDIEHNYATPPGRKKRRRVPFKVNEELETLDHPLLSKRIFHCKIPHRLIIKSNIWPEIYSANWPEVAFIMDVATDNLNESLQQISSSSTCMKTCCSADAPSKRFVKAQKKEVLECVENRVAVPTVRVPSSCIEPDACIEDVENVEKEVKEKALRMIAKLKTKKKKQFRGPLECTICKHKKFTALATLIHHYRSHAGIKPHLCKLCGSTFTRKHSLKYHTWIHDNFSRFRCEHCSRSFRHPSHFKEHKRRHTGETPYICPCCFLKFRTRNTFKRHLRQQHNKMITNTGIEDIPPKEE